VSDLGKKNLSAKKKTFFSKCFEKKMNDERNSIYGNVMLLSQSRGEISLSAFAKKKLSKTWFESKTKKNVRS
jgi:hypothetical protein